MLNTTDKIIKHKTGLLNLASGWWSASRDQDIPSGTRNRTQHWL